MEVSCSFKDMCKNYPKECHHCKWNANLHIGNYLILEKDQKTVRYLADSS